VQNTTQLQIQILNSLTDSSSPVCSSFFAVSTLCNHQSIYLSPHLLFLIVSGRLMAVLLLQMFSVTVEKSKSSYALSKMSHSYDLENPWVSAIQNRILQTMGHTCLKPIKQGMFQENRDEWDPYLHNRCNERNSVKYTKKLMIYLFRGTIIMYLTKYTGRKYRTSPYMNKHYIYSYVTFFTVRNEGKNLQHLPHCCNLYVHKVCHLLNISLHVLFLILKLILCLEHIFLVVRYAMQFGR
jgi:hypothetical protein